MSDAGNLYDEDFIAWTRQQAAALRAVQRIDSNQQVDWENLAEEIEDLGRSVRRELRSQLTRLIHHLLKLQYSPAENPRRGWKNTIREARSDVAALLAENPSLVTELPRLAEEQQREGVKLAAGDLDDYGELDSVTRGHLLTSVCPIDQILGDWFPVGPARGE